MKLKKFLLSCLPLVIFIDQFAVAQQPVPFDDKRWSYQTRGHVIEFFQGYQSLYLPAGEAELKDEKFLNGIIEFDIWLTERAAFQGFFFRRTSPGNHEEIYFRPHQSGNPDAFQYTPVFNGDAAWQLYHDQYDAMNNGFISWKPRGKGMGYNGVITFSFGRWMHVKLLVNDTQAEMYLDNNEQPVTFIRRLGQEKAAGSVGLQSGVSACWFANFTVTHLPSVTLKTKESFEPSRVAGIITSWQVSAAFGEATLKNTSVLSEQFMSRQSWKTLETESNGAVNLARISAVSDSTNTVLAKFTINSDKEQLKKLEFGYSDRVRLYCNGQLMYSGTTNFRTRDYRYLGTIGLFDAVYLPLKKGSNVIVLAVSENFGGWGVMGKVEE